MYSHKYFYDSTFVGSLITHLGVFQFKNSHGHVMHALGISLGWIYKSVSLAEVLRDNSLYETYDDQGLGD